MSCIDLKVPIKLLEGGTFSKGFIIQTGALLIPINMLGYTADFAIRAKISDLVALISGSAITSPWTADGVTGIYFDPDILGRFVLYINDEDTRSLCADHKEIKGSYDIFLYNPAGEAEYKIYGTCNILPAVTRWA